MMFEPKHLADDDDILIVDDALDTIPHELMNLPSEIRKKLTDVAQMPDSEAIQLIVENIRPDYPCEAMQISELSKNFRFDKILELLKPIELSH